MTSKIHLPFLLAVIYFFMSFAANAEETVLYEKLNYTGKDGISYTFHSDLYRDGEESTITKTKGQDGKTSFKYRWYPSVTKSTAACFAVHKKIVDTALPPELMSRMQSSDLKKIHYEIREISDRELFDDPHTFERGVVLSRVDIDSSDDTLKVTIVTDKSDHCPDATNIESVRGYLKSIAAKMELLKHNRLAQEKRQKEAAQKEQELSTHSMGDILNTIHGVPKTDGEVTLGSYALTDETAAKRRLRGKPKDGNLHLRVQ